MITIPLTTEDLTKVRLAPSPLWETISSFWVLVPHGRRTVHAPWAARIRRVLPGTDLSPLLAAMCIERACPDFLTPPPDASSAIFEEELDVEGPALVEAVDPDVRHNSRDTHGASRSVVPSFIVLIRNGGEDLYLRTDF